MTIPGPVRRLLAGHALASVAMSLPWPLLLVMVWGRYGDGPHGDLLVGLTGAARMLPYVLFSWATGMLADRFRRDRLLRVTLVGRVLLLGLVAIEVHQGWLLAAVLTAAASIACSTPAYPALAAAMPDAAGGSRRRATDLLVTVEATSFVVGPALGGLLLAPVTRGWVPLAATLLTVLALLLVADVRLARPVRDDSPQGRPPNGRPDSRAVRPLAVLRASSDTVRAVGVVGLLNTVDMALMVGLLPVAEQFWAGGRSGYGLATGVLGIGALAAPALWWLGVTASARARWALVLLGAAIAVLPLTPTVSWALLPLTVAGAATVQVESALTETIQDAVPDRTRAGVLGLTDSVMVGGAMLGSLAAPWLVAALGAPGLFVLLAVLCVGCVRVVAPARAQLAVTPEPARPPARSSSAAGPRG